MTEKQLKRALEQREKAIQNEERIKKLLLENAAKAEKSQENGALPGGLSPETRFGPQENHTDSFGAQYVTKQRKVNPLLIVFLVIFGVFFVIGQVQGMKRRAEEEEAQRVAEEEQRIAAEQQRERERIAEENWREITQITVGDGYTGGTDLVSYDMDAGEFTKKYLPYGKGASTADEVGAIVYYKSSYRTEALYTFGVEDSTPEYWQVQTLYLKIVERSSGNVLAEKTFDVDLHMVFVEPGAEKVLDVKLDDVQNWIKYSAGAYGR